jgi:NitT/TauT family transport system substrate-binding protein
MVPAPLARVRALACGLALLFGLAAVPSVAQNGLTKIRVGTPGGDANAEAWYAQDQGFFRKVGLDADVQAMRGSGAGTTAAVVGGSIDIGEADLVAIAAARQHGLPLVILAPSGMYSASAPTTATVIAKNSPIHGAKDLDGKAVAVLSLEGPSKVGTAEWLDKNGGHSETVKFVEMPAPQMAEAVARGTVAAATVFEPFLTVAKEKTQVLGDVYTAIAPRFEISAWFASADWVKKNPAAARAFAQAMRETAAWANNAANHSRSAEILAKYRKIEPALLGRMTRATYGDSYDPALAQPLLDAAYKYHSIARPETARDLAQS